MPQSCSSGFKSLPLAGAGNWRRNGLEVNSSKDRKPTEISPMTPSTRATISSGTLRENIATDMVHTARISTHNSKEPSCEPHVAVMR